MVTNWLSRALRWSRGPGHGTVIAAPGQQHQGRQGDRAARPAGAVEHPHVGLADRHPLAAAHHPGVGEQPLALAGLEQVELVLDGQDRGVGIRQGEGRETRGHVGQGADQAAVEIAVLLGQRRPKPDAEHAASRRDGLEPGADQPHEALAREIVAHPRLEVRIARRPGGLGDGEIVQHGASVSAPPTKRKSIVRIAIDSFALGMDVHQIRYFIAVAEAGSFPRAAGLAFVTQPTLSSGIAKLEAELGARLFERQPRGARLSPEGHRFLPRARAILREIEGARAEFRGPRRRARLRLGILATIPLERTPPLLTRLSEQAPDIAWRYTEGSVDELDALLDAGRLDLAVTP